MVLWMPHFVNKVVLKTGVKLSFLSPYLFWGTEASYVIHGGLWYDIPTAAFLFFETGSPTLSQIGFKLTE